MEEVWKNVYHEGVYVGKQVSNTGKVRADNGRMMLLQDNGAGYKFYVIRNYRDGDKYRTVREYAHRLVATYFIENPLNLPQVNHKDCNKSNNNVDNLEWTSRKDNIDRAHSMGRMKKRTENGKINILTVDQVVDLYTSVKRDGVGISEKARQMSIPRTTASSIMNKRSRGDITDRIDCEILEALIEASKVLSQLVVVEVACD